MLGEESILQVNLGLSNEVIGRQPVPVHDCDSEGVVYWEDRWELKHLAKEWVESVGDVVVLVFDLCFSNLHLQVGVGLREGRHKVVGRGGGMDKEGGREGRKKMIVTRWLHVACLTNIHTVQYIL